ncbi:hypothetical protein [Pseudooceanicola sp.]|jgi:hypothetical protein|uniref:hypothetical protein n=1 Tax=Pseudooceanicola sp. TaxID=1914328 RepID=UPI0040589D04
MGRKFIATILAAALAVTAISAPAQARNNDDLVKFLAGATALVIIGKAIHDSKERKERNETHYRPQPRHDDRHSPRQGHGDRWDRHDRDRHDRDRWDRHDRRISMPAECRVNVRTPRGTIAGYGYRCVQQNPRLARAIPGECVTATRAHQGPRFIYSSHCLARAGIRVH